MLTHTQLVQFIRDLGFYFPDDGLCHGYAKTLEKAMYADCINANETDVFFSRLNLIEEILQEVEGKKQSRPALKKLNNAFIMAAIFMSPQSFKNAKFNTELRFELILLRKSIEKERVNMLAFCTSIILLQDLRNNCYRHLYIDEVNSPYKWDQRALKLTMPLMLSKQQPELRGFFTGVYSKDELIDFFKILREELKKIKLTSVVTFNLGTLNHSIIVGYFSSQNYFMLGDANMLAPKYFPGERYDRLAIKIKKLLNETQNKYLIMRTATYASAGDRIEISKFLDNLKSNINWQRVHAVSQDKALACDGINKDWYWLAVCYGDRKAVLALQSLQYTKMSSLNISELMLACVAIFFIMTMFNLPDTTFFTIARYVVSFLILITVAVRTLRHIDCPKKIHLLLTDLNSACYPLDPIEKVAVDQLVVPKLSINKKLAFYPGHFKPISALPKVKAIVQEKTKYAFT